MKQNYQYLSMAYRTRIINILLCIPLPQGCNSYTCWPIKIITHTTIHLNCLRQVSELINLKVIKLLTILPTIQDFNNHFAYSMDGILQCLCDFPYISIYLSLGISFVFHIILLGKLFDNSAKNKALLEMIQSYRLIMNS